MSLILPMRGRIRSASAAADYSTSNLVATLFGSSQDGGVWDADYADTMFQNATGWGGLTAASSNGDPVGLWFDVRSWGGDTLANVLAAQSDIQTGYGTGAWSGGTNTVISDDGGVKITYVDSGSETLTPLYSVISGGYDPYSTYVITLQVRVSSGASVTLRGSDGTTYDTSAITSTSYVEYVLWITQPVGSGYIQIRGLGSGESVWVQLTSIKKVPGNHLVSGSGTTRPTLAVSGADVSVSFDGTDDIMLSLLNGVTTQPWDRMSNLIQVSNTSGDHIFAGYSSLGGVLKQGTSPALVLNDGSDGPSSSSASIGATAIVYERHDDSGSLLSIDGETDNTGTSGTNEIYGVWVGCDYAGTNCSNIKIRRFVMRSSFDTSERALAYGWAAAA